MNRNYIYQMYLFCEPYLLVLDDESIIESDIDKFKDISEKDDLFKIKVSDIYFHENLIRIEEKDFFLVVQSFDLSNKFTNQLELYGENFVIQNQEITFKFESITINNAYPSINPYWKEGVELYKKERVSYLRNIQIETLLN